MLWLNRPALLRQPALLGTYVDSGKSLFKVTIAPRNFTSTSEGCGPVRMAMPRAPFSLENGEKMCLAITLQNIVYLGRVLIDQYETIWYRKKIKKVTGISAEKAFRTGWGGDGYISLPSRQPPLPR